MAKKDDAATSDEGVAPPRFRSAADYDDLSSLRAALTEHPYVHHDAPVEVEVGPCVFNSNLATNCCDWQTARLDLSSSQPQSMEEEVKRLMELKEFAILDSDHEEKFERITALASRIFDVPICLVSLVDIGRQWFMSNRGLGEVRETSREVSFCAHAILSKQDVFIVPDTYDDPRFKENGLVTGGPLIRFYAGVPLVSPSGYKLGTFCIIDGKPRPNGLCLNEKQNLRELTEMVVDTMVHRRQETERLMDEKSRLIACAAHDLLSPLTGIQLNLGLLMEDEKLQEKLDDNQKDLMSSSMKCSDVIERICIQAIESFRGGLTRTNSSKQPGDGAEQGLVNVDQLVNNIERVVGTYPKKVPFFIEKEPSAPQEIISDDLKLFRSILNYVTNACKQTAAGSIRLRIYARKAASTKDVASDLLPGALVAPKRDMFIVEVHDTGTGIDLENYPDLFMPHTKSADDGNSGLGLYSVATEISSLGGEYGVFPRQDIVASHASHPDLDSVGLDASQSDHEPSVTGCVFWFSVPLILPANSPKSSLSLTNVDGEKTGQMTSKKSNEVGAEQVTDVSTQIPASPKYAPVSSSKKRPLNSIAEEVHEKDGSGPLVKKSALTPSHTKPAGNGKSSPDATEKKWKKCALIVDDSLTIRKALSRGLSRLGFEVDDAENGLQGFRKLKAKPYEIVLLDFLMPVMDGPEVARKFRAWEKDHRPDFHQYIVGISAHANGKDAELGIKAGMDRFMGKPVPLKSLKDLAQCKRVLE
ncbi:hypothetical protein ACHAWF_012680 [Thalassiosira exigua]